jgi:hypothetical protein
MPVSLGCAEVPRSSYGAKEEIPDGPPRANVGPLRARQLFGTPKGDEAAVKRLRIVVTTAHLLLFGEFARDSRAAFEPLGR